MRIPPLSRIARTPRVIIPPPLVTPDGGMLRRVQWRVKETSVSRNPGFWSTRNRFFGALAAVFALKYAALWQLKDQPLLQPDAGLDTTAYAHLAQQVLGGNIGLGPGLYYVSPFYIYFLAAILA